MRIDVECMIGDGRAWILDRLWMCGRSLVGGWVGCVYWILWIGDGCVVGGWLVCGLVMDMWSMDGKMVDR